MRLHSEMEDEASFCRRMHPRLVGAMRLHTGDPQLAEELAQEALARAWQHWPKVAEAEAPDAWVFRVALNLASSRFRRITTERRAVRQLGGRAPAPPADDAADRIAVREAVEALPPRQRAALVLRYYADLPVAEVAIAMGCAPGTVKSLTSKAIEHLRRSLALLEVDVDA